jgi:hypothetical protein
MKYDYIYDFHREVAVVLLNKKAGVINRECEEIIPPDKYDFIFSFNSNNLAHVILNGKNGVIDINGNEILSIDYDSIFIQDEYITVTLNKKEGLFDINGMQLIPCIYDSMWAARYNNLFVVVSKKKCGLFNVLEREEVVAPIYDSIRDFQVDGTAVVYLNNTKATINSSGEIVTPFKKYKKEVKKVIKEKKIVISEKELLEVEQLQKQAEEIINGSKDINTSIEMYKCLLGLNDEEIKEFVDDKYKEEIDNDTIMYFMEYDYWVDDNKNIRDVIRMCKRLIKKFGDIK